MMMRFWKLKTYRFQTGEVGSYDVIVAGHEIFHSGVRSSQSW